MFKMPTYKPERTSNPDRHDTDWDALNEHIATQVAAPLNKPRSLPGVISGIYDLGIQQRDPFEGPWNEKDSKRPGAQEFKDEKGDRMIRVPSRPAQGVAITVDFPQITVDKGEFFGKSDPKPYRMLLNGEFSELTLKGDKRESVVGRPYFLSETKDDSTGVWALAKTNNLHKLASACGLLDDNGLFKAERVGELLGKVVQFQISAFLKPSKSGDRKYLTETIKIAGVVPEGIPIPTLDPSLIHGLVMHGDVDMGAVETARASILNTCKRATNFAGSDLEKALANRKPKDTITAPASAPVPSPAPVADDSNDWPVGDDDIPF